MRTPPLLAIIGLLVVVVGVVVTIIGLATTTWQTLTHGRYFHLTAGLFTTCQTLDTGTRCENVETLFESSKLPEWLVATRALVIIGIILGVTCLMLLVLLITKRDSKILHLLGLVLAFTAGVFVVIGISIYATKRTLTRDFYGLTVHADLGWSFVLTTAGGAAFVVAGVIVVVDTLMRRKDF